MTFGNCSILSDETDLDDHAARRKAEPGYYEEQEEIRRR